MKKIVILFLLIAARTFAQESDSESPVAHPPTEESTSMVLVTLDSNRPSAVLNRVGNRLHVSVTGSPGVYANASGAEYEVVCTVPCRKLLDRNAYYSIGDIAGGRTAYFLLPNRPEVTLKIRSGSPGRYNRGFLLGALGSTGLLLGAVSAPVGIANDSNGALYTGIVAAAVGLPLLILGIVVVRANMTDVTTDQGEVLASRPKTGSAGVASLRKPGMFGLTSRGFGLSF